MPNIELTRIISASYTHDNAVEFLVEATVNGVSFDEIAHTYVEGKEDEINQACGIWLNNNTPEAFVEYTPDDVELGLTARSKRDDLINGTMWIIQRHQSELANDDITETTLTAAEYQSWLQYHQDLRDITTQDGFPQAVTWPEVPSL